MNNDSVDSGRKLVLRVAIIATGISILTIVMFNIVQGTGRLPQQLVRFWFTLALCYFLVRGRPWARWISIVLFLIAGIGSVVGSLSLIGNSLGGWVLLAMGAAYLYCSVVLIASPSIKAFCNGPRSTVAPSDQRA